MSDLRFTKDVKKELYRTLNQMQALSEDYVASLVQYAYIKGYDDACGEFAKQQERKLPYGLKYSDKISCLLSLPTRAYRCLSRLGIDTINDLKEKTPNDLLKLKGMGEQTLAEILDVLHNEYGIYLKGEKYPDEM